MTDQTVTSRPVRVATWSELEDRAPAYALVENVDLVVVRYGDRVSVLGGVSTGVRSSQTVISMART